jgi:beta-glucosidase
MSRSASRVRGQRRAAAVVVLALAASGSAVVTTSSSPVAAAPAAPVVAAAATTPCSAPAGRPWCDTGLGPDQRAALLVDAMTLDEKVSLLGGDDLVGVAGQEGTHTGTSNGIARLGVPPVYFSDGPVGVRQGKATGMPSPMSVAASFDPKNARAHAKVVGDEVRRKGNDVVFAPMVNIMRTPLSGRTFEGFGEDPYLAGEMATGWIRGVQSEGVIGDVKHYAANNQEGLGPLGSRLTVDVRVSERALREIYLPAFEAAVKKGDVGTVMCAYPRVNGQYACENEFLLSDVLKGDWGFKGFVLTDYAAGKNTIDSLNNGLDLDIFPGAIYHPALVLAAVGSGLVNEATIDEHVHRILRTMFAFGMFDRPVSVDRHETIDKTAHNRAAAEVEAKGIVLLRNRKVGPRSDRPRPRLLPLREKSLKTLAVIGPEAHKIKDGGGSSTIDEFFFTTPLTALRSRLGASRVVYDDGSDAARAAAVAAKADAAVVVVGDSMTEVIDKLEPTLNSGQTDGIDRDALIARVAAAQQRTVVVLQSGGPVLTPWRTKVPALVEMWYPGQNGGTALAQVLFGDIDPGGRLPVTFPRRAGDLPTAGDPEKYPGVAEVVTYKEGVMVGYRWYDHKRLPVAYPFGAGRSYTKFRYSGLRVNRTSRTSAVARFTVTNVGARRGTAVPQLYVGMPAPRGEQQAVRQLKGFKRLSIAPGRSRVVRIRLGSRAFSYWSTGADDWRVVPGCYRIDIGTSSRHPVLTARKAFAGGRCRRG